MKNVLSLKAVSWGWIGAPVIAAILYSAILPAASPSLRVGVAATDITPPLGIPMAGYYHERGADGVLDPLYCKAMVLESGNERVALVALDIITITRAVTDRARAEIESTTGIKGANVMISATHAHTGPVLANRGLRDSAMGGKNPLVIQYTEKLPQLIAESVRRANLALQPASISFAKGRCENLAYNRRYFMRDGTVAWNPGKLNPNIVIPAGPVDPEVGVLYIEAPNPSGLGKSIGTYINFAMHPDTTGGSKISADWPGALSRVLANYHGTGYFTMVANGTCGNINHIDTSSKLPGSGTVEQNRIATILGGAVLQAYKDLKPVEQAGLRTRSQIVELTLPEVTPQQLDEARKAIETTKDDRGANFMKLVRSFRVLDVASREGKPHRLEVQVITLGRTLAWVALPGEIFVELGLAIKKNSPFTETFIAELANENIGYIPDRRSYAEGNYEPESSRCAPGSGEKLVDAAVTMLNALYKEALPDGAVRP